MRALVLTSNSLRHKYYAQKLSIFFNVVGIISEPKRNYYNNVKNESSIVKEHFIRLVGYEMKYFKDAAFPKNIELMELEKSSINNDEVVQWAKDKNPDIIFLFGTVILQDNWLNSFPEKIINLHLGLSPFYRGSATLFWPIHNNELSCIGVTIHIATKKVDAGNIIGRVKPLLLAGDNYYAINCKAIKSGIDAMPKIINSYLDNNIQIIQQDLSNSKLYKKSDFNEQALLKALENIGTGLTANDIQKINESNKCNC
jgi:methionyl-tRNA formyltransferase